jgi:hypothetical protein
MISDTDTYITLKKMFETKGKQDREIIKNIIKKVLIDISWSNEIKKQHVMSFFDNIETSDPNYIDIICKNYPQILVYKYSTLKEELNTPFSHDIDLWEDHNKMNFIWYILIKSSEIFYKQLNRYPGEIKDFTSDIDPLKKCIDEFISHEKNSQLNFDTCEIKDDHIYEFCRFSNSKIPPVVSVVGSMVSQEAIKLITYQFKTIENTIIYDGINSTISTFKF